MSPAADYATCLVTGWVEDRLSTSSLTGNLEIYRDGCQTAPVKTRVTFDPAVDVEVRHGHRTAVRIAFHTNRDGNFEIYVMNADGSGAESTDR